MSKFIDSVEASFGSEILDQVVRWIGENLSPDDVFTNAQLADWAGHNGWIPVIDADKYRGYTD